MTEVETTCRWLNCQESFDTVTELGGHILHQHVKVQKALNKEQKTRGYFCQWEGCKRRDKAFKGCYNLEHHVRYQHTKEKPFICDRAGCTSSFSQQSDLKEHLRKLHREIVPKAAKRSRSTDAGPDAAATAATAGVAAASVPPARPAQLSQSACAVLDSPPLLGHHAAASSSSSSAAVVVERPTKLARTASAASTPPIFDIRDHVELQLGDMNKRRQLLQHRLHFPIAGLVSSDLLWALQDPLASLVVPKAPGPPKSSLFYLL